MNGPDAPVVIAYDGSAAAREALVAAAALLRPRRTVVLTVWEGGLQYVTAAAPPDVTMAPLADPAVAFDLDRELEGHAERVSGEGAQLARSLGLEAEPLAVSGAGDIAGTILDVARERKAAGIVMGSRGLGGLRARLEGSTSKDVVKHAPCPVLVVHEEESG